MTRLFNFIILIFIVTASHGQVIFETPMSDRITGYKMDVELDPTKKTVSGTMEAFWVNCSDDIVEDIRMHMYLNAFRSNKSTFFTEEGGSPGSGESDFGWVEIISAYDRKGYDLTNSMKYIQPDDNNSDDLTVLKIDLTEPALPGDTVYLNIEFVSKLPSRLRRTGFNDDYFFVAQWFPKIAVYEPAGLRHREKGGWNCHQFHNHSEFYANHSVYEVNITLPEEYVIGSGGLLIREELLGDGRKLVEYRAEDIVDFAWTAWPDYKVATDEWNHVKIRFLYPPGREDQVDRQLGAVKNALEYLGQHVGPFPWPHVTFVDPPTKGAGAGGMEYTTIFTSASSAGIPEFLLLPEMVTVHEFGHAYFMGILANNEFEEPWIDEGINSYWEQRIMDHYWGPGKGIINHKKFGVSDRSTGRIQYVHSGDRQVTDNRPFSWDYAHGTYGMMSYMKAANWLSTLEGIIGENTINEVFRVFYNEWGFNHPDAQNFVDITNRVVSEMHGNKFGPDMNWFFEQTLYGTGICDYKVDGILNNKERSFKGIVKSDTGMVLRKDDTSGDTIYTSVVKLQRLGEVRLPVELLIHFENGDEITEHWDGKARYKSYSYERPERITWARIDPEYKIVMDVNYLNNSYTLEPDRTGVRKAVRKLVTMMQFMIQILSL
ncbi:MAG TPA: M1 family metallopeptidase [Bacteroidales bacterium]|nr:M1 family metallopeptidase [Bacteroidales bacterium]